MANSLVFSCPIRALWKSSPSPCSEPSPRRRSSLPSSTQVAWLTIGVDVRSMPACRRRPAASFCGFEQSRRSLRARRRRPERKPHRIGARSARPGGGRRPLRDRRRRCSLRFGRHQGERERERLHEDRVSDGPEPPPAHLRARNAKSPSKPPDTPDTRVPTRVERSLLHRPVQPGTVKGWTHA